MLPYRIFVVGRQVAPKGLEAVDNVKVRVLPDFVKAMTGQKGFVLVFDESAVWNCDAFVEHCRWDGGVHFDCEFQESLEDLEIWKRVDLCQI